MDETVELLKRCLETRSPILLLGAGFSHSAKAKNGENLMLGGDLCYELYEQVILPNRELLPEDVLADAEYYSKREKLRELCTLIRENNMIENLTILYPCHTLKVIILKREIFPPDADITYESFLDRAKQGTASSGFVSATSLVIRMPLVGCHN